MLINGANKAQGTHHGREDVAALSALVAKHEATLLTGWVRSQIDARSLRSGQIKEGELTGPVTAVSK